MTDPLNESLAALSRIQFTAQLDSVESAVCGALDRRRQDALPASVQFGVAAAALALGLVCGLGSVTSAHHARATETQVLSDDSMAPSSRIGGA